MLAFKPVFIFQTVILTFAWMRIERFINGNLPPMDESFSTLKLTVIFAGKNKTSSFPMRGTFCFWKIRLTKPVDKAEKLVCLLRTSVPNTYPGVQKLWDSSKNDYTLYFIKKLRLPSCMLLSVVFVDPEDWKISCVFGGAV